MKDSVFEQFSPISLNEMERVKLMNRLDFKFLLVEEQLIALIPFLVDYYYVLEVKNERVQDYTSIYFDTIDNKLYTDHHNGKQNRYKIRKREYKNSDLRFIEVKYKTNKGRTIKNRQTTASLDHIDSNDCSFLKKVTPYNTDLLVNEFLIQFNRVTLVSKDMTERSTIDFNLVFGKDDYEHKVKNVVVLEIKVDGKKESTLLNLLHEFRIKASKFSKYCLGKATCFNDIKKNNFKSQLITLNKLESVI